MKFLIQKRINMFDEEEYWTIPKNLILRFIFLSPFGFLFENDDHSAYNVFDSKDEAIEHIKRYNSGYYKKKYKKTYV